jgi:hypothetical protein
MHIRTIYRSFLVSSSSLARFANAALTISSKTHTSDNRDKTEKS